MVEKLILQAVSYVEKLGQPYLLYLLLLVAVLHVGSRLLVQLVEAFVKTFPRKQPINLDAYHLNREDVIGRYIIAHNRALAFKNTWGKTLELSQWEQLIALHAQLSGRHNFTSLVSTKDYMDFSKDPIRIKISAFQHFEGYFFKICSYVFLASIIAILVGIGLLSTIDPSFLNGNAIFKLLVMVILFAFGARFFNWAQSDYATAKRLRKMMAVLP